MSITRPMGFRAAATTAGLKKSGKPDLTLIVCESGDAAGSHLVEPRHSSAAVFTRCAVVGAPIEIGRAWRRAMYGGAIAGGREAVSPTPGTRPWRAILINAGAANAATGAAGVEDARACMQSVAGELGCTREEVIPSSTGVIGHRIPVEKIKAAIPALVKNLARGESADADAAGAIMTTDLVPKTAHREVEIGGHVVHIGAIAKGSGMIAPVLDSAGAAVPHATMLGFITTDAGISGLALQHALEGACHDSFERISVDAHPSCSDTVLAIASGAAPARAIREGTPEYHGFKAALSAICRDLAEQIVRDGEGATRVFRVEVRGAHSTADAERIARAVVDSPLVKCAVHGKDPNWGRIVTAAGNAGVPLHVSDCSLSIGGIRVFHHGTPTAVSRDDPALKAAMGAASVQMELTVGHGDASSWMMGCDLSKQYVSINADYTT
ncbi:MAG: bifunctional glutamate N-acetyltransferase/amino-acid acetyltransferase ArgJ [Phycisphaerales bacterium]